MEANGPGDASLLSWVEADRSSCFDRVSRSRLAVAAAAGGAAVGDAYASSVHAAKQYTQQRSGCPPTGKMNCPSDVPSVAKEGCCQGCSVEWRKRKCRRRMGDTSRMWNAVKRRLWPHDCLWMRLRAMMVRLGWTMEMGTASDKAGCNDCLGSVSKNCKASFVGWESAMSLLLEWHCWIGSSFHLAICLQGRPSGNDQRQGDRGMSGHVTRMRLTAVGMLLVCSRNPRERDGPKVVF